MSKETIQLKGLLKAKFEEMMTGSTRLFEVDVQKDLAWNTYLASFPEGTNDIHKERPQFDCNACSYFIKTVALAVSIKNGKMESVWDIETDCEIFAPVVKAMRELVHGAAVKGVFYYDSKEMSFGQDSNKVLNEDGTVHTWHHMYLQVPKKFQRTRGDSSATTRGNYNSAKQVFERGLKELTVDALDEVLALISENNLYRGTENKTVLDTFLSMKNKYDSLGTKDKDLFLWESVVNVSDAITGLRGKAIGTLLVDISEGKSVDAAVRSYEKIVAGDTYMRPKAVFTQRQLEEEKQIIVEKGYQDSLLRRFATLDDITVNNILFSNKDAASRIQDPTDVFAQLSASIPENPKKFDHVQEVSIEEFLNEKLNNAVAVEALVENKHIGNLSSLITAQKKDSKSMFKWDNNFSLAYKGNMADSLMAKRVREAGGRTDGVLRFTHSWNHAGQRNASLMDLHVFLPNSTQNNVRNGDKEVHDHYGNNNRVGWNNRKNHATQGSQDVDYVNAAQDGYIPIENITFPSMDLLPEGEYVFKIHNWKFRNPTTGGFKAEIAFGGQIFEFNYDKPMENKEWVTVAKLKLKDGQFEILEMMENKTTSKEEWGINTNQFVPVTVISNSPNYWDEQQGTGNKHYMFMLKDCVNPETPNGFYNEFLNQDLMKHKRVLEALGGKLAVVPADDQLSGISFSSTQRNDLIVKVVGKDERIYKIKF